MNEPTNKRTKTAEGFAWSISTSSIDFLRHNTALNALEGSGTSDCSCNRRIDPPVQRNLQVPKKAKSRDAAKR